MRTEGICGRGGSPTSSPCHCHPVPPSVAEDPLLVIEGLCPSAFGVCESLLWTKHKYELQGCKKRVKLWTRCCHCCGPGTSACRRHGQQKKMYFKCPGHSQAEEIMPLLLFLYPKLTPLMALIKPPCNSLSLRENFRVGIKSSLRCQHQHNT